MDTSIASQADFDALPPSEPLDEPERQLLLHVTQTRSRKQFTDDVCALFVAIGKVDGELIAEEVRAAKAFFRDDLGFTDEELDDVRLSLKAAMAEPVSLAAAAERCAQTMTQTERTLLINALFEVALADGALTHDEERLLSDAATGLRIPPADLRTVFEMHLGTGEQHYKTLGLNSDMTDDQLKRAYKRLIVLHHPDRVAHLGAGAQQRAAERFHELQDAWAHIRRVRGL